MAIATVLGILFCPVLLLRPNPLVWRPTALAETKSRRATSRMQSFVHASQGIRFLLRNEPNMRIHLIAALTVTFIGLWLDIDLVEWRWLGAAIAVVMIAEAFNTGVEQVCNAITLDYRTEIKAAKDVAAGGVLLASIAAAFVGISIFMPHFTATHSKAPVGICSGNLRPFQ